MELKKLHLWCELDWNKTVDQMFTDKKKVQANDGQHCPDWEAKESEKPKEKMRVWTCLNCGKDICFDLTGNYYSHCNSNQNRCCNDMASLRAIPKPGSERWIEK